MSKDFVKEYHYPDGELQRVHVFVGDSFDELDYAVPKSDRASFKSICDIYDNYLVKTAPYIFGRLLLFCIPEDFEYDRDYVLNRFNKNIKISLNKKVSIKDRHTSDIYNKLLDLSCIHIVCGYLPKTKILPVGNNLGYLSDMASEYKMVVNSSFFIFDGYDCSSLYDRIGMPFGLMVKNGFVLNPPLFDREALFVENDRSYIRAISLNELVIKIGDSDYTNANSIVYSRPKFKHTPKAKGLDLVIVGRKIVDINPNGNSFVPSSGFVLHVDVEFKGKIGDDVTYQGLENIKFAIQVGNSAVCNSEKTNGFKSKFFNIRHLFGITYPPCLYPLNYQKDRAARIVLGTDLSLRPYILWFEGAGKLGYIKGMESCGASLSEVSDICEDLGLINAVNLDGGGSAQMLINGKRSLKISDRNILNGEESQRPIPICLCIRK